MREVRHVPDTRTDEAKQNLLTEAMVLGSSGAIERQEAAGQASLVKSDMLPTKGLDEKARAYLTACGFKIGQPADDLFTTVEMPQGWSKKPTDHSMWSELVDDKGRVRAGIFYKAAFYDRSAHLSFRRRYAIDRSVPVEAGNWQGPMEVAAMDGNTKLQSFGTYANRDYAAGDVLAAKAKEWLDATYPGWEEINAYWD